MQTVNFEATPFGVHTSSNGVKGGVTLLAWPTCEAKRLVESPGAYVSIAQCNLKDMYSRGTGRKIARERGEDGQGVFIQFPKHYTLADKRQMLWNIATSLDPDYIVSGSIKSY